MLAPQRAFVLHMHCPWYSSATSVHLWSSFSYWHWVPQHWVLGAAPRTPSAPESSLIQLYLLFVLIQRGSRPLFHSAPAGALQHPASLLRTLGLAVSKSNSILYQSGSFWTWHFTATVQLAAFPTWRRCGREPCTYRFCSCSDPISATEGIGRAAHFCS